MNLPTGRFNAVNLERYEVVSGEVLEVSRGYAMVCGCAVLLVDGFLRLDGVVRVG